MELDALTDTPNRPAVYALYAGSGGSRYVAYVGVAGKLKQRLIQHFVRRDSSVTTGTSAVGLNPDYVTEVVWWEHPQFDEREALEAAEIVAFEILNPALRSRGAVRDRSREIAGQQRFRDQMEKLLQGEPVGSVALPTLESVLGRVRELEERVRALEGQSGS